MQTRQTEVRIKGEHWLINGRPTYEGREYQGWKIEGLLLNSRMIQGIFDDENEITKILWAYPDIEKWDPDRNTLEFVEAMPEWRKYGLIGINVGLQGGAPSGYYRPTSTRERLKQAGIEAADNVVWAGLPGTDSQPWLNSAFDADGNLKKSYLGRMNRIIDQADALGMVVILNLFYFGQDERLRDEVAIRRGVEATCEWILGQGYSNVVLEISEECDHWGYEHKILRHNRVHELHHIARGFVKGGRRLLVGSSYMAGRTPDDSVVAASDFILMHGNHIGPARIREAVAEVRLLPSYRPMPILFTEDDHYDFELQDNNFTAALSSYAGWGYFDPGNAAGGFSYFGRDYCEGFQTPPINWRINTPRKKAFFSFLAKVTGCK